jgi:CD109 antigen
MFQRTSILVVLGLLCVVSTVQAADVLQAVVVAPDTLYSGNPATVNITALSLTDNSPVRTFARIVFRGGEAGSDEVAAGITDADGRWTAQFATPQVARGAYTLDVIVTGLDAPLSLSVQVREMPVLLIETDKPIYKPGQTIQGRVLTLSKDLLPESRDVDLEITDGKGIKIYREAVVSNAFGVASFELDLATELNYGTWKISAESGSGVAFIDVRVEKYVLPRFDVQVDFDANYFLVDEVVTGTVSSFYFFGQPVDGTVEIVASRYVGIWEEYASYTATLTEGLISFELPAVEYLTGTEGAGGSGSLQLEIVVTDTGEHDEKSTELVTIVDAAIKHQLIPLVQSITPEQPFDVALVAETPDGIALSASADVTCTFYDENWTSIGEQSTTVNFTGVEMVRFDTPADTYRAEIRSDAEGGGASATASITIYATYSPTSSFLHIARNGDAVLQVGDVITLDVVKTHDATVYYDVFAKGHTVWSDTADGNQISFQTTQHMVPSAKVVAYVINPNNEISADALAFDVHFDSATGLLVGFDAVQVLPGETVNLEVQADGESMVGLSVVDESVYALNEGRLNMQEVFNELERRFMEPQEETHGYYSSYAAYDVFEDAGLQVVTSTGLEVPQSWNDWRNDWAWELDDVAMGGGGGAEGEGEFPAPSEGGDDGALAEVSRVRQFFPETWLWMPELLTATDGTATLELTAPDSITTWRLHAVSTSPNGLGIDESELLVFQEFFGEPDLPYAVTRGDLFPVRVQIFNYLDTPQNVQVER